MKYLKNFENMNSRISDYDVDSLTGKDKEVYEITEEIIGQLYEEDFFNRWCERNRAEPIITSIIDQNATWSHDNPNRFPPERKYYVFINNYYGDGYIELEIGMDYYKSDGKYGINITDADTSNHGYPASYGETIYSYNKKGEIEYKEDFWL